MKKAVRVEQQADHTKKNVKNAGAIHWPKIKDDSQCLCAIILVTVGIKETATDANDDDNGGSGGSQREKTNRTKHSMLNKITAEFAIRAHTKVARTSFSNNNAAPHTKIYIQISDQFWPGPNIWFLCWSSFVSVSHNKYCARNIPHDFSSLDCKRCDGK